MKLIFKLRSLYIRESLAYNKDHYHNIPYIFKDTGDVWFVWDYRRSSMKQRREASYRYILKRLN